MFCPRLLRQRAVVQIRGIVWKDDLPVRPDQPRILVLIVKSAEQILDDVEPRQTLVVGREGSVHGAIGLCVRASISLRAELYAY